jgi:serine/threonine-protein kinase
MNEATAAHDARRSSGALIALAKAAPDAFRDRDLVSEAAAVTVAAALDPSLADDVFALLSGPALGEGGPDVLFHVASFYGGSRGASRAALLLANPEVLARASPALRVTRDFKALACKLRPSLFDRAAAEGDERTLALLTAMLAAECDETSGACCAPHDPQLAAATSRLRQRLHK